MTRPAPRGPVIRLLPSILTILAFSAGLSAINFAIDGRVGTAIGLIATAALLDSLDGRIARLLDATSDIGAELDSLSDAVAFGVAPALVLYVTLLQGQPYGWVVALAYAVSIVLRLARFNTALDDDTLPAYSREYFVGVPSPAGALVALAPLAARSQFGDGWWSSGPVTAVWMLAVAAIVVSRIPTFAMKSVSVPPHRAVGLLVLVAAITAGLLTYPYVVMLLLVGAYLVHIPFAVYSKRWVAAHPETWDIKPAQRRAIRAAGRSRRVAIRRPRRPHVANTARLRLRRPRPIDADDVPGTANTRTAATRVDPDGPDDTDQ